MFSIVRSLRSRVGLYFPPVTMITITIIAITIITLTQILQLRTLAKALLVVYIIRSRGKYAVVKGKKKKWTLNG